MSETRDALHAAMSACSEVYGDDDERTRAVRALYDRAPTETVEHGEDDIVRELLCEMCGRDYPVWSADSDLWNEVMREPGPEDEYAFVCPTCFTVRAAFMGVETSFRLRRSAPREVVGYEDELHEAAARELRGYLCGEGDMGGHRADRRRIQHARNDPRVSIVSDGEGRRSVDAPITHGPAHLIGAAIRALTDDDLSNHAFKKVAEVISPVGPPTGDES